MVTTSSSHKRRRSLKQPGMRLTSRDIALLTALWVARALTGRQIQRLLFSQLSDTVYQRRLTLLTRNSFLVAAPLPFGSEVGSCPYRYTLGDAAIEILSTILGLPRRTVALRVRQDRRLLPSLHRQHILDCYIAYRRGCEGAGYAFTWVGEDELARANQSVQLGARRASVRADAYFTIDVPGKGKASAFLEFQNISLPNEYRSKVAAYCAYYRTGAYTTWSGFKAPFRVLGVVETLTRAKHLKEAAEDGAGAYQDLFWSAPLPAIINDPFGAIWFMGGGGTLLRPLITPG